MALSVRLHDMLARAQRAGSDAATSWVGHHLTLAGMIAVIGGWSAYGVAVGFTREWFLVTNISGTVIAFLILLLVQHARHRSMLAIQAKLDQLIYSSEAKNWWIGIERNPVELVEEMRFRHHDNAD